MALLQKASWPTAENAEFRGGFLLNLSAFPLPPLRLRGEIDLFAVESPMGLSCRLPLTLTLGVCRWVGLPGSPHE